MNEAVSVALLGTRFMGRAHSNAWLGAARFFDLTAEPVLTVVAGRDPDSAARFARRWGWKRAARDWREAVADPSVTLVDVATPNHLHAEQAIAALEAGKHVACEKPLAGTLDDARAMRDAARTARARGRRTFVWFNYRRAPAVALAHRLVAEGRLGRLFHVRAVYLQDWGGPLAPRVWRFDAEQAGSGAHGDLNAHIIDLARFVTGEEIVEVAGAIEETFIRERKHPATGESVPSTVDDCVLFLARLSGGAVASFEATRLATGNQNRNAIEINGALGSIRFDFERMNELEWWDHTLEPAVRGWSRILCTEPEHPYIAAYWPAGHGLGYEHGFTNMAADIVRELTGGSAEVALADFEDAYDVQRVLEAALVSAREKRAVQLAEISQ